MDTAVEVLENQPRVEPDTDREAMLVADYMQGLPHINIGALIMPPIWGPAKGIWATILWYPLWVFADNCIYAWWSTGTLQATIIGALTLAILIVVTVVFAVVSTPYSALRAIQKGKTKEEYQRGERVWALVSIVLGIIFIAFATYYNLCIRMPLVS